MNRMNDLNCLLAEKLVEDIKKDYEASGIAVAIIDKSGKTQYEKFWGVRDLESGKEVNGDTIFGLASVTKSFTALSIMQLEEKGIIDLDAPISQYIPEFTNKNQSKKVTVRHLLSHAGGFFPLPRILVGNVAESLGLDEEKDGDFAYNDAVAQEGVKLVAERLDAQTKENGLNGQPGEYLSYCNDGFGLLSDIIRRYGGEPSYADYLVKHGVPFRDAHGIVGQLVLYCIDRKIALDDMSLEELKKISPVFEEDIYEAISMKTCVEMRNTIGAPGERAMKEVIEKEEAYLKEQEVPGK